MSSLLHLSKLNKLIPDDMRYVRRVSVGESHCLFQMGDCNLWGVGSNEHGQLGLPLDTPVVEEMREIELEGLSFRKFNAFT
jgi:alpha-tubulin suppressor-like RCC1 family protein